MIIRKLEETRLNTHQQHFEDLVLFGEEGLDEIDDKIERFKLKLQDKDSGLNTTTKIDGAPAVVCWHKFKGLPDNSICLKSFMTNNPKVISTLEDIESKYNDRPGMSKMLEYCLELSRYIPSGEAWQGDCLFISNTKKEREINGTDYITFQPNKIIYAFSENNPGYGDVKNAEFGIAFHTIYTGDVENKSQNFNVKAEDLNAPSKFYILSPALNITNKQEFNLDEINNLQIKFNKEADNLKSDPAYNELINNKEFMGPNGYWNTFENSILADKRATTINVNTFIADLKEYINDKLEKEYNKKLLTLKTDKGKEKALLNKNDSIVRLNDLVENNKQTLTNLVNCLNTAATIKMLMWQGFKKNKTPYDTYYQSKSKGYIQADPEGIAMSDSEGNIVKLVDRSTFSSYNRDDDFISGFDHNESLEALDAFKLLEDVEDRKAAVAIFGKFNPPTKAHRKMIQAISDKAKSIGATPIVFASHKVGGDKHPLSYEDKFKYLKAAFGDLAEVKKSEANSPFQILHELYLNGYTDVIYFSGPDRIGLKSSIPAYNGPKNDKLSASDYYKFNTVDVEILDFEGSPESEIRATKARQAVKDNDFELFKTLVPFNENVAKQLFNELEEIFGITTDNFNEQLLDEANAGQDFEEATAKKLQNAFSDVDNIYFGDPAGADNSKADIPVYIDNDRYPTTYIECKATPAHCGETSFTMATVYNDNTKEYEVVKLNLAGREKVEEDENTVQLPASILLKSFNDSDEIKKELSRQYNILKSGSHGYKPISVNVSNIEGIDDKITNLILTHYKFMGAKYLAIGVKNGKAGTVFCDLDNAMNVLKLTDSVLRQKFDYKHYSQVNKEDLIRWATENNIDIYDIYEKAYKDNNYILMFRSDDPRLIKAIGANQKLHYKSYIGNKSFDITKVRKELRGYNDWFELRGLTENEMLKISFLPKIDYNTGGMTLEEFKDELIKEYNL